jgi:hypothetical protein
MDFMPRTTLILAVALLAAPAAAWAQPGPGAARPAVDECGAPIARRPRRDAGPAAAVRTPPRVLGVRSDSAASGTQETGTASSSTAVTEPAISPGATAGTAASSTAAASAPRRSCATVLLSSGAEPAVAGPNDPRVARRNRAALRLGLGPAGEPVRLGPAASVSVPTALGVDAGELFFGVAYQGRTRYTEQDDGAAVIGFGVGTRRVLALEAAVTTYSTFRGGGPLETGGVSLKLHRALPRQTSVAVGWENAVLWGGSDDDGSLYAVASRGLNLRPDPSAPFSTGVVSLGVGNGRFRREKDDAEGNETVNLFAAAGVRVNDPLSLVMDWTGQDLNAAASITPLRRLPLVLTVGLADITGSAGDGARFILSLGYGLAFPQPF